MHVINLWPTFRFHTREPKSVFRFSVVRFEFEPCDDESIGSNCELSLNYPGPDRVTVFPTTASTLFLLVFTPADTFLKDVSILTTMKTENSALMFNFLGRSLQWTVGTFAKSFYVGPLWGFLLQRGFAPPIAVRSRRHERRNVFRPKVREALKWLT